MKLLKYNLCTSVSHGTEETPVLHPVIMGWNAENEEIAKQEAYNGEYTIEDDGVEENVEPTQFDWVEAQVAYTAMITNTLLEV
jgi:hypothetical protein